MSNALRGAQIAREIAKPISVGTNPGVSFVERPDPITIWLGQSLAAFVHSVTGALAMYNSTFLSATGRTMQNINATDGSTYGPITSNSESPADCWVNTDTNANAQVLNDAIADVTASGLTPGLAVMDLGQGDTSRMTDTRPVFSFEDYSSYGNTSVTVTDNGDGSYELQDNSTTTQGNVRDNISVTTGDPIYLEAYVKKQPNATTFPYFRLYDAAGSTTYIKGLNTATGAFIRESGTFDIATVTDAGTHWFVRLQIIATGDGNASARIYPSAINASNNFDSTLNGSIEVYRTLISVASASRSTFEEVFESYKFIIDTMRSEYDDDMKLIMHFIGRRDNSDRGDGVTYTWSHGSGKVQRMRELQQALVARIPYILAGAETSDLRLKDNVHIYDDASDGGGDVPEYARRDALCVAAQLYGANVGWIGPQVSKVERSGSAKLFLHFELEPGRGWHSSMNHTNNHLSALTPPSDKVSMFRVFVDDVEVSPTKLIHYDTVHADNTNQLRFDAASGSFSDANKIDVYAWFDSCGLDNGDGTYKELAFMDATDTYGAIAKDDNNLPVRACHWQSAAGESAFTRKSYRVGETNTAPYVVTEPTITGTASAGNDLTCSTGVWENTVDNYFYQWLRDGVEIDGAVASTYTVLSGDSGDSISCRVIAQNVFDAVAAVAQGVTVS